MNFKSTIYASVLALTLSACGGSGGGGTTTPPPVQQPPPPVAQKGIEGGGIVNQFGASFSTVTISGVTYDATSATLSVTVDDQPAQISDLAIGNVVSVVATTDDDGVTAVATQINQINDLEGPIAAGSIDQVAGTFVVLGQTVRVVATTVFDDSISPRSLAGLADGDPVEVSVLPDGNGGYTATRIERDDDPGSFELTGVLSGLDTALFRFQIGNLTVDYATAALDDFDNGVIANGDLVEVEGNTVDANGVFIATQVEQKSTDFQGTSGDFGELEGFVTRFVSSTDFDVAGFPITTNAQTVYDDGVIGDLALGVRLEIDGALNDAGVLVATKVDFEDGDDNADVEFEAFIDAVDTTAMTLTVLGQEIDIPDTAALEDDSDADIQAFSLDDLAVGDFVEIKAYVDSAADTLVAVQLKRDDDDDNEVEVQGPAADIMQPSLTIVGVSIATTPATRFAALNDLTITADAFFTQLEPGALVKAEGTWDGVTLTAREIEFEDD